MKKDLSLEQRIWVFSRGGRDEKDVCINPETKELSLKMFKNKKHPEIYYAIPSTKYLKEIFGYILNHHCKGGSELVAKSFIIKQGRRIRDMSFT